MVSYMTLASSRAACNIEKSREPGDEANMTPPVMHPVTYIASWLYINCYSKSVQQCNWH